VSSIDSKSALVAITARQQSHLSNCWHIAIGLLVLLGLYILGTVGKPNGMAKPYQWLGGDEVMCGVYLGL